MTGFSKKIPKFASLFFFIFYFIFFFRHKKQTTKKIIIITINNNNYNNNKKKTNRTLKMENIITVWDEQKFKLGLERGLPWERMLVLVPLKGEDRDKIYRTVDINFFFLISLLIKSIDNVSKKTCFIHTIITSLYQNLNTFFDTRTKISQLDELSKETKTIVLETMAMDPESHTLEYLKDRIGYITKWLADRLIFVDEIPENKKVNKYKVGKETFLLLWSVVQQPNIAHRQFMSKSNLNWSTDLEITICQEDQVITNLKRKRLDNNCSPTQEVIKIREA